MTGPCDPNGLVGKNCRCRFSTAHCSAESVLGNDVENMLASSAAEQTGCNSGKAASPVSFFVQREWPVFLSGTSNMLILLGRCLELSLYL